MARALQLEFRKTVLQILYLLGNAVTQREAASNNSFRLFLNFDKDHVGAGMGDRGLKWPQTVTVRPPARGASLCFHGASSGTVQNCYGAFLEIRALKQIIAKEGQLLQRHS